MIINPLRTWWKVRKNFKFPRLRFYFGKHTCGLPMHIHDKPIHVWISDIMWKDKWYTPRHEYSPQIGIRFFKKWQLLITFEAPCNGDNDQYWEQILWTLYYKKNDPVIAKHTWQWKDYKTQQSTWDDKYLTENAIWEILTYDYRTKIIEKNKEEEEQWP